MSPEHLDLLVLKWSQSTLTADEAAELDAILRAHPEARARFRRHALLDAALREHAVSTPPLAASTALPIGKVPRPVAFATPVAWALAAAVALLLSVGTFFLGTRRPSDAAARHEETNVGYAVLTRTSGAEWIGKDAQPRIGDSLGAGLVQQTRGIAQIEFFSGATLVLEGDAELEIVSAWEAKCHRGKARVRVPPAARGFRLHAPGMKVVDLGTEFGVSVVDGRSEVQVFEGEVEAHPDGDDMRHLKEGQGLAREGRVVTELASLSPGKFTSLEELDSLNRQRDSVRYEDWQAWSQEVRKDRRLIGYYTFKHWEDERWSRLVNNFTEPRVPNRAGGAVGATWTQGRWPMKDALQFKRPGDRVRMNLDGTYDAITLACWVKVDGLDRKYNALLLTDGYEPGEPHWQITEDGCLFFSILYPDEAGARRNQMYFSPVVFTRSNLGRWHYLAVTYDNRSGAVVQYVDGAEVSREVHARHQPGRPIVFGPCEMGNWGLPTQGHQFPIRNLNGALDEFAIYGAALSAGEIRAHYSHGRPD